MIYVVMQDCGGYETSVEMVTTDFEKACACLNEYLEHQWIEVWEDGGRKGKQLD